VAKHFSIGALLEVEMSKKWTPLWREARFQKLTVSDHFWKLRCRKSARRCGTKQISKSKCTRHTRFGTLLIVEMSKKCTPLWREAHVKVKHKKLKGSEHFFDVRMSFCEAGTRDSAPCQKLAKREGLQAASTTTTITLHYTPLHYIRYIALRQLPAQRQVQLRPDALCCPEIYRDVPGMLVMMMMMMIEDLQ